MLLTFPLSVLVEAISCINNETSFLEKMHLGEEHVQFSSPQQENG